MIHKYLVIVKWGGYDFENTFLADLETDPYLEDLKDKIIKWFSYIGEGSFLDCLIDEDREDANSIANIYVYLIYSEETHNFKDIFTEAHDHFTKLNEMNKKEKEELKKQEDLKLLKELKEKYEN